MSGSSYSHDCHVCGCKDSVMASEDYKPHPYVSGTCLECGIEYWTISGRATLEELNELRRDMEMEELSELPEIVL